LGLGLQENPRRVLENLPRVEDSEWIHGRMYEGGKVFDQNVELAREYY
jgi:hypothetical protein